MEEIKVRTSFRALARGRAARTCALTVAVLAPLLWFLLSARAATSSTLLAKLYLCGACAPLAGIVVAVLGYVFFVLRNRKPVLSVGKTVSIPASGVSFPTQRLGLIQLFSLDGVSYAALLPEHLSERLSAATIRSGRHNLSNYLVAFPKGPTVAPYEVAEELKHRFAQVEVEKIGAV